MYCIDFQLLTYAYLASPGLRPEGTEEMLKSDWQLLIFPHINNTDQFGLIRL